MADKIPMAGKKSRFRLPDWIPVVAAILAGALLVWIIYRASRGSSTVGLRSFGLTSVYALRRESQFYEDNYDATLRYLLQVYPTASDSLRSLSPLELACFYNSLWFYYNCESAFNDTIEKTHLCWEALPDCGKKYAKMPYTPQGWIYSFKTWIENNWTPYFDSDSTVPPKEVAGAVPGRAFGYWYNGPAPVWMFQRVVFRYIFDTSRMIRQVPCQVGNNASLCATPPVLKGNLETLTPQWTYPHEWWKGVPSGGYMEITAASEPGLSTSPPLLWYDGWVGSGTFLAVGNTHVALNKIHACFTLCKLMRTTSGGEQKLQEWFGTTDPYQVCKNLMTGNRWENRNQVLTCKGVSDPLILDSVTGKKIRCGVCNQNSFQAVSIPNTPAGWYGNIDNVFVSDWANLCQLKPDARGNFTFTNECIDKAMYGESYRANRISNGVTWDEPMFVLGLNLQFDTIQIVTDPNGGGWWQYEILELRGYPEAAKNRDYSEFIRLGPNQSCPVAMNGFEYIPDFTDKYMDKIPAQTLSVRDPLDVYNESKVQTCTVPSFKNRPKDQGTVNLTCKENLSNMFRNLQVFDPGNPVNCQNVNNPTH